MFNMGKDFLQSTRGYNVLNGAFLGLPNEVICLICVLTAFVGGLGLHIGMADSF